MTKKTLVGIGLLAGLLALGSIVSTVLMFGWDASKHYAANPQAIEAQLKIHLQEIKSPERSHFIKQGKVTRETQVVVSNEYRTDLSFDQLKQYYDSELSRHGWEFKKETEVLWDRQNFGGKHLLYCKGEFTVDLEYAGKMENEFGWTYVLSGIGGLSNPCTAGE